MQIIASINISVTEGVTPVGFSESGSAPKGRLPRVLSIRHDGDLRVLTSPNSSGPKQASEPRTKQWA